VPLTTTSAGDVSYEVEGAGSETILWISGTGCPGALWRYQVEHFAGRYRCITYDLPGCAGSSVPASGTCTPRTLADTALELLDALDVAAAHHVGFSLGAAIAQELMLAAPARALSGTLIGTWGSSSRARHMAAHYQSRRLALRDAPREVFAAFGFWIWSAGMRDADPDHARAVQERFAELSGGVTAEGYEAHYDADLAHEALDRLPEIACPVLVINGDEDFVTLPRYNRAVAAAIPGARHEVIPGGGHMVWLEQPAVVNGLVADFLDESAQPH
jgi:3-oxoadipate enol-lactonase